MNKALGLIEVIGLATAIEAADAALKAANIKLLGVEKISAGIVTVKLVGDVGAVKASVEAAEEHISKFGTLRTVNVIPRVADELISILPDMDEKEDEPAEIENFNEEKLSRKKNEKNKDTKIEVEEIKVINEKDSNEKFETIVDIKEEKTKDKNERNITKVEETIEKIKLLPKEEKIIEDDIIEVIEENMDTKQKFDHDTLAKMSVKDLRKLAITSKIPVASKKLKYCKKEELIELLLKFYRDGEI
ncbi:BMC domain-containing protein [Clostridium tarantellae]|uniref:BMC domain-containing protein n=1 Tax=Clostridium tarantellae TaxID=39493 RepID=A0A6I1MJM0_9CLOT|nr:BMC domain-containing protein [Clostridium tarantellae]MPQ42903.1 BMC domain-containing protein [Clostridium tarantellae]